MIARMLSSLASLCFLIFLPPTFLADALLANDPAHTTNQGLLVAGARALSVPGPTHLESREAPKPQLGYRPLEWSRDALVVSRVQHVVATILRLQVISARGHLPATALPQPHRFASRKLVAAP
jgi:hypothetical protein